MRKITLYSTLILLSAFWGCKPEEEFDGPSLVDLYGEFFINQGLQVSDDAVDFAAGEHTTITASLSKNVSWKLDIKGLSSGALKTIESFSNNVSYTWDGTTTRLPVFHVESCALELTFENQLDTLRDTIAVLAEKVNQGFLLADFETGVNPGWEPFVQSGANMSFVVQTSPTSAQGNRYYDMGGQVTWDWLIGYLDLPSTAYGAATFPLSSNASQVYFNTFLYKPAGIDNGLTLFRFQEDDNGDGIYNSSNEDMWSFQISGGANGWSQITQKYDQMATLVNGNAGSPIGNGLHEPEKLVRVQVLFLANPTSGYSQAYLDYMIFTEGAPLIP